LVLLLNLFKIYILILMWSFLWRGMFLNKIIFDQEKAYTQKILEFISEICYCSFLTDEETCCITPRCLSRYKTVIKHSLSSSIDVSSTNPCCLNEIWYYQTICRTHLNIIFFSVCPFLFVCTFVCFSSCQFWCFLVWISHIHQSCFKSHWAGKRVSPVHNIATAHMSQNHFVESFPKLYACSLGFSHFDIVMK
jgi:hypothetical protein